jgi:ABC-type nickel/cobalt efflux system permease component RcnA
MEEKNIQKKPFDSRLLETIIFAGTICACGAAIIVVLIALRVI